MNLRAIFILILVTAIWGVTFPLIYNAMAFISPERFVGLRFALASLVLLPFVWQLFRRQKRQTFFAGILLGLLNGGIYVFQAIGLKTILPAKSAFITALYVVLVPLIAPLFRLGKMHISAVISALMCLYGLYVLTGGVQSHIGAGEIWTGLCALSSALQILALQKITQKDQNFSLLAFYQILFTVPFALIMPTQSVATPAWNWDVWSALIFCGVFATSLALFLQTKYQHHISANQAALIYCLEPVFASFFSVLIDHSHLDKNIVIGGLIIFTALLLSILARKRVKVHI